MPKLQEDPPASLVHGLRDLLPTGDLGVVVDAWGPGVALAFGADLAGFADDQAGVGALGVVAGVQFAGDIAWQAALAGQGRHHQAVGQGQGAELQRREQVFNRHRTSIKVIEVADMSHGCHYARGNLFGKYVR